MSELAVELGRRVSPDYVKGHAKELLEEKKDEWKTRAKEKVMRTTSDWRMNTSKNPRGVGILGALLGAGLGATLAKRLLQHEDTRFERTEYWDGRDDYRSYGRATGALPVAGYREDYDEGSPGLKDRASESMGMARERVAGAIGSVKERSAEKWDETRERASDTAASVKERANDALSSVREHIPSRDDMRDQAYHARDVARRQVDEKPVWVAMGAIAFGFAASLLLPVSSKERRALAPAKQKAGDALSQAGDKLEQKISAQSGDGSQASPSQAGQESSSSLGSSGIGDVEVQRLSGSNIGVGSSAGGPVYRASPEPEESTGSGVYGAGTSGSLEREEGGLQSPGLNGLDDLRRR